LSKFEGEMAVRAMLVGAKTNLVIVRPCAVVGPGCAGNIPRLVRLIMRVPILPFGAICNLRSFIAIDDLAALIGHAALSARSPEVVLAAHRTPISTPDLIRALAYGLERKVFLAPIPVSWLGEAAKCFGHWRQWQGFSGSFQADVGLARHTFGFDAQTPVFDALIATAKWVR
jgi:UDP-glucose 4-epimerase